ncbi:hypothetical protein [Novipirellula rosea]|uniref:Protein kinase domain-containing protein n=1 Tax=Novipirellula rosea TaxID=1031540 RepID=A0ABP8NPI7_9BACT
MNNDRPPPVSTNDAGQENLRDCISNAGTMAIADAMIVVDQITVELGRLHRCGKAHGAIGPSNIVLTDDGVAKIGGAASASLGPHRDVDIADDFRGLGWTLHFMLTGCDAVPATRPPESDPGIAADAFVPDQNVLENSLRCSPAAVGAADLGVANPIFRRLVSRDETQRYASAEELRSDLRRLGFEQFEALSDSGEPQVAEAESSPIPRSQTSGTRRHWAAALVVVAVVVVAAASRHYWP